MNIQDFRFLYQGKLVSPLLYEQMDLLKPIDRRSEGRERALLMLHGFSSSPAVFRGMLPALHDYDAVICPALPGHAESISAFAKVTAQEWVNAAEKACKKLLQTYQTVDVLGFSLGGLLACHLAQCFSINHLFLLAPAVSLKQTIPIMVFLARILSKLGLKTLPNRGGNFYNSHYAELTYNQLPLTTIIEILTFIKRYQLGMPSCPTDLFLGRHDAVVDSSAVAKCFQNQPNVAIHWLENSAHMLPLDGDIETIVQCVSLVARS